MGAQAILEAQLNRTNRAIPNGKVSIDLNLAPGAFAEIKLATGIPALSDVYKLG